MKLSLIIFLSLLIFTGTAKNHTATEDFSKVLLPVNDEEEEAEEASKEKVAELRPIVHEIYIDKEPQPEDGGDDNDALKLHNSLQSLREYLEMLNRNKNQEESVSKEESVEENEFGPHYHTMYTNEPPMEIIPEELQEQENVGDNPPKDVYFQPIPISDKIGMAERNIEVGTGGGQQIRETVLLAVSSATLAVLLLLTVFCAAAVYYCSRPYNYLDDYSYTSSERRLLLCPSDASSYTRTEDSSLVWSERTLTEQSSSEIKHTFVDEISTFSDESARTAERDKSESVPCDLEPGGLPAPSVPPPAEAVPPPALEAPPTPVPPPAPEAPPAPAEGAPPPAQEAPPASAPAEGAPPGPPAEGVPPPEAPPPAV